MATFDRVVSRCSTDSHFFLHQSQILALCQVSSEYLTFHFERSYIHIDRRGWRNEDPEPRVGGGGPAERKIVTSPILMAEVVVDVPKGTSDGSPGVQDVLELL